MDDRFEDEANERTEAERDEAETQVAKADELRTAFREFARTAAKELHAIGMLDVRGLPGCDSAEEVIEGAADEADELFIKLLWSSRFEQTRAVSLGEY